MRNTYRGGSVRVLPDYTCPICGKVFRPTTKTQKFCAWACSTKGARHPGPKVVPLEVRFWRKVNKHGPIPKHMPHLGACWLREGHIRRIAGTHSPVSGYRLSWELHNGPIPEGMEVCHHCDNPKCVRPTHLFIGTHSDNIKDCYRKGRMKDLKGVNNPNYRHGNRSKN